jgi:trigger factor
MQVTVEDVSKVTKKIKVTLSADIVGRKLDAAFDELKSDVSIKGFRKGKVPRRILEKSFGDRVQHEVAEKLIQDSYFEALEKSKLDAVVHPQVRKHAYAEDGSFAYEAEVDVRPAFELGDYKNLTVEIEEIPVDDGSVIQALGELRRQMAPLKNVTDRPVEKNDVVVIDFQGYDEGQALKQVSGENYTVEVGSGKNGREFEENLIGLTTGEEANREVDFPQGFSNPLLAGKKIEFKIKVKDIKERALPELDDEFAKDVDQKFSSLDELKEHIRSEQLKKNEERQKGDLADKIVQKLIEMHDFEVPNRLVVYEAEMLVKEMEQNLLRQGVNIEAAGLNRDKLAENYREPASRRVKGDFVIKKIAEQEEIKIDDVDIEEGFKRISEQYGMTIDEVKKYFKNREDLLPFMNELLNEKVLDFLRKNVQVKKVAAKKHQAGSSQETDE